MRWLLVLLCLVGCGPSPQPSWHNDTQGTQQQPAEQLSDVSGVLRNGDGHDWLKLSDREKLRLCNLIATTTGQRDGWYYREFLGNLYYEQDALNTDIARAAATAAALGEK